MVNVSGGKVQLLFVFVFFPRNYCFPPRSYQQRPVLRLKALPKKKRRLLKLSADGGFDEEDLEIKRLEKLLGVRESGSLVNSNLPPVFD